MEIINQHLTRSGSPSESISVEMERDAYKEKIEHFKLLIRQLQQEIQCHKVRKEGAETVSRLLQESKQEAVHLQRKVRTLETALRNLQARLENHGLSSDLALQEGETYIPGQSKQLLDNLTRENTRLRAIIRKSSGDPEEMNKLQQGYQHNTQTVAELQSTKTKLETRVAELEVIVRASDSDKEALRAQLRGVQADVSTRDRLCTSLSQEATGLKKQLNDVAHKCRELAQRLEEKQDGPPQPRKEVVEKQMNPRPEETSALLLENRRLQAEVTKVTEMNKRWQDYNIQREQFVKSLQAEVADLKTKVSLPGDSMLRDMNEQVVRILDEAKGSVLKANEERDKGKKELEKKTEMAIQLSNQVQQMNAHLNRTVSQTSKDDSETMAALKTQIQICTEDFESERRDREKSQAKVLKYEEELRQLRAQLEAMKRHGPHPPQVIPATPYVDPFYHYQLPGPHGNLSGEGLAARGIAHPALRNIDRYNVIDGGQRHAGIPLTDDLMEDGEQTHVVAIAPPTSTDDGCSSLRASSLSSDSEKSSSTSRNSTSRNSQNHLTSRGTSPTQRAPCDILKCPKCSKEYTSDQHNDLLEHIDVCCE